MECMKRYYASITLFLYGCVGLAHAVDPVSWALTPASGFSQTEVGQSSVVSYTLTNHLPFPAAIVTTIQSSGGKFETQDACNNTKLAPNASCRVDFIFTPQQAGNAVLQFTYGYHNNRIPLPALTAVGAGATQAVTGYIGDLPATMTLTPLQEPIFTANYTNTSNVAISGYAGNASGTNLFTVSSATAATITVLSNSCGTATSPKTLQPAQYCQVQARIIPSAIGTLSVNGLFTYNNGSKTSTPSASSVVQQGSGGSCTVNGIAALPLPTQTYQFADNMVKFVFTNPCISASTTLSSLNLAVNFSPNTGQTAVTTVSDSCSGVTLPAQGSCSVLASVIPQNTATTMTVSASVVAGGQTTVASTSSTVNANNPNSHVVHFINQCPFSVWYGIANGNDATHSPDPTPGSQNPGGAPSSAYLLLPQLTGLAPTTIDLTVPAYINGAIWPRTNCASNGTNFACGTGMCNTVAPDSGTCVQMGNTLAQPVPPFTKFEFTIESTPNTDGVYDVSLINGFNVPVEIKGLGAVSSDPFHCTGSAAVLQPSGSTLGSCSWQFDPSFSGLSAVDFVWVTPGPDDGCTSNASCSNGQVCGMAFTSAPSNAPINRRCGDFIGYTTIANFIGYTSSGQWGSVNLYNQFNIGTPMTSISSRSYGNFNGSPAIFGNMLACQITDNTSNGSCYNSSNPNLPNCCGCVNWSAGGSPVPTATSANCLNINSDWTTTASTSVTAENAILWLKKTCPTAYSYQFDDPSVSFTCNSSGVLPSYQITFCPGGISSLPIGATDGRI